MADGKVIEDAVTLEGLARFLDGCRSEFAAKGDSGGAAELPKTVGELPDGS